MSEFETSTDTELIGALPVGSEPAIAEIYDRFGDRVYSYALNTTDDGGVAEEVALEALTEAVDGVDQLEEPGHFRPWLFSLARARIRASGHDGYTSRNGDEGGLRRELLGAVEDLGTRDRHLMMLHLAEGLEGEDLALAMGIDESNLDEVVSRMRRRVEGALGPLLIARLGNPDCDQVEEALGDWGGVYDAQLRARLNRHIGTCERCGERRNLLLSPASALPGILLVPAPTDLRTRFMAGIVTAESVESQGETEAGLETADTMVQSPEPVPAPAPVSQRPAPPVPPPAAETVVAGDDGLRDLPHLALFVLITVVVGLIGFAVAGRFTPLDIPQGEVAAPVDSSTTTTSQPGETTSTTSNSQSTAPSSTTPASPADIGVGADTVDFGEEGTSAEFDVTNAGGSPGDVAVATSSEAIALSAGEASVAPGESTTFQVSLDRDEIEEGDIAETITVAWEGGEAQIAVVGTHEDNPIIHNPQASPPEIEVNGGAACLASQTTISARVRDTSPLESVVARWNDGSNARQTAMTEVGEDIYEGVVGPFNAPQTVEVRIVAFDERGNAGGAAISVNVLPCP